MIRKTGGFAHLRGVGGGGAKLEELWSIPEGGKGAEGLLLAEVAIAVAVYACARDLW
jgi:hypothetical protein